MKPRFQTKDANRNIVNVSVSNYPKLFAYLNEIKIDEQKSSSKLNPQDMDGIIRNAIDNYWAKPQFRINADETSWKPIADEYKRVNKITGEPAFIPAILRENGLNIIIVNPVNTDKKVKTIETL